MHAYTTVKDYKLGALCLITIHKFTGTVDSNRRWTANGMNQVLLGTSVVTMG